jgi:hypothetical protein
MSKTVARWRRVASVTTAPNTARAITTRLATFVNVVTFRRRFPVSFGAQSPLVSVRYGEIGAAPPHLQLCEGAIRVSASLRAPCQTA